jgi:hypothetical protein|uniref:RING-type domain-containing protein n=1 Tax=viral metagenome TaxID=1070528 RepID=A0A6C0CUG2_9ZZZZ
MKINRKSRNKRKSRKKIRHRKKSTTRKHKRCKKCFKGGMMNGNQPPLEECSLCLNEINIQDDGIMFRHLFNNCTHDFHKECIVGWINTLKTERTLFVENERGELIFNVKCPLCREELTDDGTGIIQRISEILDMNDSRTRRNMFRDLLQYDYPYDANEDTFFRLYIFPIPRRIYENGTYFMYWHYATLLQTVRGANFFYLSFVITGNDARRTLIRDYDSFRYTTYIYMFLNLTLGVLTNRRNERNIVLANAFIVFIVLNFDNIYTDTPTEINTNFGIISLVDIIATLINMFGRFIVNNADFGNYNPNLPDRQLGGASNATTIQNNKRSITFKITSMEDVKEFLDIVDKNKTKLESLLDKVPFTLSAFFPEVEYTPELVQKLRPLIKN